jgi:hypothetical protein
MKPDGGPAFPIPPKELGMTLRDYFAVAAMQSLIAKSTTVTDWHIIEQKSYEFADRMLAERLL